MDNQKYNSVPEMVAAEILKTKKYLKAMKKALRLMNRHKPVEDVMAALNEAKDVLDYDDSDESEC